MIALKVTIDGTEYSVSESSTMWTLTTSYGKVSAEIKVSKSDAATLDDLIQYVRDYEVKD